jgi:hypothetical protein
MMIDNPIIEEIRDIRHRLAAQYDNDVYRIGAEIRRGQAASGRHVVQRPKRQPRGLTTTDQTMHSTEFGDRDSA